MNRMLLNLSVYSKSCKMAFQSIKWNTNRIIHYNIFYKNTKQGVSTENII